MIFNHLQLSLSLFFALAQRGREYLQVIISTLVDNRHISIQKMNDLFNNFTSISVRSVAQKFRFGETEWNKDKLFKLSKKKRFWMEKEFEFEKRNFKWL